MTPTVEIADIVLPAVHWSERDEVCDSYTKNYIFCHPKIVDPPEDCWEDKKILIELARKLGLEGHFQSVEESLNDRLKRLNMTFEAFKKIGFIEVPVKYKKHETFGAFKTRSKKVELYSEYLEKIGSDPLPVFREPPESPVSTPELAEKYPLVLITGANSIGYFHSSYRNVPSLRKLFPSRSWRFTRMQQERGVFVMETGSKLKRKEVG
jgi:anaerobic selenocysteine-containing dehydrogenase